MNPLIKVLQQATELGVDEHAVHIAEVLLRIAKAEFNIHDELEKCMKIGPNRNAPPPEEGAPPLKGKRSAEPSDIPTVVLLDAAIDYIRAELEGAPGLTSPDAAQGLMNS